MNQDTQEAQTQTWEESHPWLSQLTEKDDEDTVGEVMPARAHMSDLHIGIPTGLAPGKRYSRNGSRL